MTTATTSVIEEIREAQAQREAKADASLDLLAQAIAGGEEVLPAAVEKKLAACGRTLDDLEAAVDAIRQRERAEAYWKQLRLDLDDDQAAIAEQETADAALKVAAEEFQAARKRYGSAVDAHTRGSEERRHRIVAAQQRRSQRLNSAPAEMKAEARRLGQIQLDLDARRQRACEGKIQCLGYAKSFDRQERETGSTEGKAHFAGEARRWRQQAEEREEELTFIDREKARVAGEQAALERRMIYGEE